MSQITKGKWKPVVTMVPLINPNATHIGVSVGSTVVAICGEAGAEDEAESIANANLIAAAKDLYEAAEDAEFALDKLVRLFNRCPEDAQALRKLQAAIKKARGE